MKLILVLLSIVALLAIAALPCSAKEWRGFVPLVTSRAQVLNALGNAKHASSDQGEYFDLPTEVVTFRWIHSDCGTEHAVTNDKDSRLTDVVLQITVRPKLTVQIKGSDDRAKSHTYRDWLVEDVDCIGNGEDGIWNCTIWNGRDGFGYSTSGANVTALYYYGTDAVAKDWNAMHKSCSPSGAT
jgi:hypothetical protein